MEKRFLNVHEAAQYLGVTGGTLYAWVCYRRIPYVKIGRLVKFDLKQLDAWTQKNSVDVLE